MNDKSKVTENRLFDCCYPRFTQNTRIWLRNYRENVQKKEKLMVGGIFTRIVCHHFAQTNAFRLPQTGKLLDGKSIGQQITSVQSSHLKAHFFEIFMKWDFYFYSLRSDWAFCFERGLCGIEDLFRYLELKYWKWKS